MGGLAQSVEYVATAQPLEGVADALSLLGELDSLLHHVGHFAAELCDDPCGFGHYVSAKHLKSTAHYVARKQSFEAAQFPRLGDRSVQLRLHLLEALLRVIDACLELGEGAEQGLPEG